MIDIDTLKAHTNLATLVEADLGPAAMKRGRWYLWRCPFHADTDPSLAVTPDTGTYHCFGCGATGDVITWLREREGLTFEEACERLGAVDLPDRPVIVKRQGATDEGPPPAQWQERALDLVETGQAALWGDLGSKALAWLRNRGLKDATIKLWRLGYNAADHRGQLGWLPRGITIPCEVDGVLWYVKIRRPVGQPKYQNITGGKGALFGAHKLDGHSVAVLTEGEFDCMLLDQEIAPLADGVAVASLGGAGKNLSTHWMMYLLDKRRVFVAYDADSSGLRGAARMLAQSKRVRQIRPLKGNDVTDFYLAGGRLRDWVEYHLTRMEYEAGQVVATSGGIGTALVERLEAAYSKVAPGSPHAGDQQYLDRFLELLGEYEGAVEGHALDTVRSGEKGLCCQ